jgi:hypothetical protein
MLRVWDHPLGGPGSHRVLTYRLVLYDRIGDGPHRCHWCGREVNWTTGGDGRGCPDGALAVDHLDNDIQNHSPDNLVVSCNNCNALRGFVRGWQERTGLRAVDVLRFD